MKEINTEMTLNTKEINGFVLVGDIPEDAVAFEIYDKESLPLAVIVYRKDPKGLFTPGIPEPHWPLTKGNYSIIGLANQLTEGDCKQIVEYIRPKRMVGGYKDYTTESMVTISAISSFNSLLKANNLNPNTTLILKKIL